MSQYEESSCVSCARLWFDRAGPTGTCTAFPDGIPAEILEGQVSHDEPYKGDNGIQRLAVPDGEPIGMQRPTEIETPDSA